MSRRDFLKAMAAASALTIGSGVAGCAGLAPSAGSTSDNIADATPSVERSAMIAVRDCMGAKMGERMLIVTDKLRKDLGLPLYDAAQTIGCEASCIVMELRTRSGEEPTEDVARAMLDADVVILATKYSLTHTDATSKACSNGARVGSMPIQSGDSELVRKVFATGGMTADPNQVYKTAKKLRERLKTTGHIHITTEPGTDISFEIRKGYWAFDTGLATGRGSLTNLPGGEVMTLPANTNGVIMIDGSFGDYGLLASPLELTIRDGLCTTAKGDHADDLNALFAEIGSDARNIGEFGIGINPRAQLCGIVLEDEKAIDTIHIALGNDATFGGDVRIPMHFDGIVTNPRIEADGEILDLSIYR